MNTAQTRVALAVETSQRRGSVAVRDLAGQVHYASLGADLRHDDALLPAVDRLYADAGLRPVDTGVVCVSVGPGGFTGLRIGVATGKLLAEVLGADLVAVPSALVVAESFDGTGPIIVALASKDATAWLTRLEQRNRVWTIVGAGRLQDHLELNGIEAVLADEHLPDGMRRCCDQAGVAIVRPVFDARSCMIAGMRCFDAGDTVAPATLAPLYSRAPAVTLRQRR